MNYSLSVFPCSNVPRSTFHVPRSTFLPDYRKSKFFNQLCEISTEISWVTVVVPFGNQSFLEFFSEFGNTYNRASLYWLETDNVVWKTEIQESCQDKIVQLSHGFIAQQEDG